MDLEIIERWGTRLRDRIKTRQASLRRVTLDDSAYLHQVIGEANYSAGNNHQSCDNI